MAKVIMIEQGIFSPHRCGLELIFYVMYIFTASILCSSLTLFLGPGNLITKFFAMILIGIFLYVFYELYTASHENDHLVEECIGDNDNNSWGGMKPYEEVDTEAKIDLGRDSPSQPVTKPDFIAKFNATYLPLLSCVSSFIMASFILTGYYPNVATKLATANLLCLAYLIIVIKAKARGEF